MVTILLIGLLIGVLFLIWGAASIKIIGPDEMAVFVLLGEPVEVLDSGLVFVPWCFNWIYLKKYPKKMYNLEYKGIKIITKGGEYQGVNYAPLEITVDAAAYLNFPRVETPLEPNETTHPLIKILKANVPIEEKQLQDWTQEAVESAIRLALGNMPWKQATEEMQTINQRVNEIFADKEGALYKAGFRLPGIKLVISRIQLPTSVEEMLTAPERKRLEVEATLKDAEAQAIDRLGTVLAAFAQIEGIPLNELKQRITRDSELQKKLQDYILKLHADLEKADRGAYFKLDSKGGGSLLDLIILLKKLGISKTSPTSSQEKDLDYYRDEVAKDVEKARRRQKK